MSKPYKVTTPDGKTITVEGPDDATDEEVIGFVQEHLAKQESRYAKAPVAVKRPVAQRERAASWNALTPDAQQRVIASEATPFGGPGFNDALMQGPTAGLADEALGVFDALGNVASAPFTGDFSPVRAYTEGRDEARYRADQAYADSPILGTAGTIVGGFAGALPKAAIAGVAQIPNVLQTIKSSVKGGVLAGALGGWGSGQGAENSLVQGALGGIGGGVLGAAIPAIGWSLNRSYRGYQRLLSKDPSLPRQIVGDALTADANTGASAGAMMDRAHALGVPYMLADTGENARGLVASVARQPGASRTTVLNAVGERQRGQGDRIRGAIERDLGPITNTPMQAQALHDTARLTAQADATAAEQGLRQSVDAIAPVADRATSGAAARDTFEGAHDAAKQRTRDAYGAPELTNPQPIEIPVEFFARDLRAAADDFYGDGGGLIPLELQQIIDDAAAPNATTRTLTNIDRRLADFAGAAQMRGARSDAAFANRLRSNLDDFANRAAPAEYRAALANAKAVRAEQGRLFETRDLPQTFARDQFGNPRIGDTAVPGRLARPGASGGDTADSLIAAVGSDQAEALARGELRRVVEDMGTPTAAQAQALVTRYGEMAQRFPSIASDLNTIAQRAGGLEAAQSALATAGRPGSTALEQGAGALNHSPEEMQRAISGLNDADRGLYAQGYRNSLADVVSRRVDDADKARALIGTDAKRRSLEELYSGAGLDRFSETLGAEQAANQTFRSVFQGSQTAERLAADALNGDQGLVDTAIDRALSGAASGDWKGFIFGELQRLKSAGGFTGMGKAGQDVRQSIATLLTETDPAVLSQILAEANAAAAARLERNNAVAAYVGDGGVRTVRGLTVSAGNSGGR